MYCVYKHTSPSGKVYIGQTKQKPSVRFANGNGYRECPAFYNAIQKYGWDNIKHEILFDNLTEEEANKKERELISEYRSNQNGFGYNVTSGGQVSFELNEDALKRKGSATKKMWENEAYREKMSASMRGENNPMYGVKMSVESRRKMSEAAKRRKRCPMSAETKAKLSAIRKTQGNFRTGTHHKEETKQKISDGNRGEIVVVSDETKAKISATLRGVPKSESARENMRKAQINSASTANRKRAVNQIDAQTGSVICTYSSLSDAVRSMGISGSALLCACCKGRIEKAYGYRWQYAS